ncbi:ABC transporter permease [Priestia aryabhattai]|uniref:ABC transporter permease n=1 Tax=Priestia aryabhattai TaxID=412384 RepID=A0AAX6N3X9_PRIAR|nr:ABC transporter permease [Priestia aryabhattai]MDU9690497.1 ABC transporter permease [Priestia aryabhattai]
MLWQLCKVEWFKLLKTKAWIYLFISPILIAAILFVGDPALPNGKMKWLMASAFIANVHGLLLFPLIGGLVTSFVCRYEHEAGGWKQLLSLPVTRTAVYGAKLITAAAFMGILQVLVFVVLLGVSMLKDYPSTIPLKMIAGNMLGGWIAVLPILAFMLAVSMALSSFGASLTVSVILTLPNLFVVNSERFGPWYPWTQPMYGMLGVTGRESWDLMLTTQTFLVVIISSFLLFVAAGSLYFHRKHI